MPAACGRCRVHRRQLNAEHNPNDCPYCANSSRGITGVGVVFHDVAELKDRALAAEAKLERVRALAEEWEVMDAYIPFAVGGLARRRLRECLGEKA